ncbi:hypothetical protein C8J56DRAFT_893687 [Mycena floridula]|nr:hypothetical protein C8J56DRAFT_893687 [Mycena floridula]
MPVPSGEASGSWGGTINPMEIVNDRGGAGGSVNSGYGYTMEEREERERQGKKIHAFKEDPDHRAKRTKQQEASKQKIKAQDPDAFRAKVAKHTQDFKNRQTKDEREDRLAKKRASEKRRQERIKAAKEMDKGKGKE